jgi:hypothetical protein
VNSLGEAHRLYTEMSATGHAERVARELAELGAVVWSAEPRSAHGLPKSRRFIA